MLRISRVSGTIWLVLNLAHQEFSVQKGISVHVTGETSPKNRAKKMVEEAKKCHKNENSYKKRSIKFCELLKDGHQNFQVAKKKVKLTFKGRPNKFGMTSCALSSVQSCASLVKQCTELGASASESIQHSGWISSIPILAPTILALKV